MAFAALESRMMEPALGALFWLDLRRSGGVAEGEEESFMLSELIILYYNILKFSERNDDWLTL
jgi:hypothetical protein